ncbi:unnamed protein product [Lathyrus oleraceus]
MDKFKGLYEEYVNYSTNQSVSLSQPSNEFNTLAKLSKEGNKAKKSKIITDFKTWNSIESRFVLGKNELDIYFDDELLELNEEHSEDFDVLLYWKFNEKKFSILSIMARDVLSIPITTVAYESLSVSVDVFLRNTEVLLFLNTSKC